MRAPVAFPGGSLQYFPVDAQSETSEESFRDGPKDQTRNLEIPDSRFARPGMTVGCQCFVTGWSEKSRIASVNGNSSTISPSSSVTSRIAFKRPPSAPSDFSSSRIIARAISHARSGLRGSSPSGSEINSSPMRVLKKYRGIGRNPLRLGLRLCKPVTSHEFLVRNTPDEVAPKSASGSDRATLNLLIRLCFDAGPHK